MKTTHRTLRRPGRCALWLVACLALGCGSSSYLMRSEDQSAALNEARPRLTLEATAEPSGTTVRVQKHRMALERAEPVDGGRVRVRPRRPLGLLIAGSVTLGIGVVLTGAGIGIIPCPANYFCENGLAVATLLGVGVPHVLVGTILDSVGGALWSPETHRSRP